ncbi:MAG: hypothetical protein KatS3mg076_0914 [Candidatus Binatia bacterium]|nr:MAG: hypothetical protein KatS3mg076_0914 [Candidatus Binatia bacterium]
MTFGVVLFLLLVFAPSAGAGPITFSTALPIPKGQAIVRGQALVAKASQESAGSARDLTAVVSPWVFVYGAREDLALFLVLPALVHKSLDAEGPGGKQERSATGFGDVSVFARYTVFQRDLPGETLRVAPFAGLEAPTGKDNAKDESGRLPRPLQPGSGSWDAFFGSVFTWQKLDWELDLDAGHRLNTRDEGFEFGDVAFADASFQYRLWPREVRSGLPGFLYAVLETNLEWQDKNRIGGKSDPDSGGWRWFVDPGIQYVGKRFVLEAVAQLPALEELGGQALETDFQLRVGFRWNFWVPFS